jgi:soluble lytic murein transglycosylase
MGMNWRTAAKLSLNGAVWLGLAMAPAGWAQTSMSTAALKKPAHPAAKSSTGSTNRSTKKGKAATHTAPHHAAVLPTPESRRLTSAFTASAQLRPMAQQLVSTRNAAAYAGVASYAGSHSGEAAAAAYLALGHAYSLDHRYTDAETAFRTAQARGQALSDYADFLAAQAAVEGNRPQDAVTLLEHFAEKHPGSLFIPNAPLLESEAYLDLHDAGNALRVLTPFENTPAAGHSDFQLALGKAYQASGNAAQALALYRQIYLGDPLSAEATSAKTQLAAMNAPLAPVERKQHADAMFNAKQYSVAAEEYRALQKNEKQLTQADRDALEIYAAVCDLRLKRLTRSDVSHLPVTGDDSAALKMYLQSELARNEGEADEHDELVKQIEQKYPASRWLEEALYSGGNMYLVKKDSAKAIVEYEDLVTRFPHSTYAPSAHWHAAWLNYRMRQYPEAARLMDEQILNYPAGTEVPGALYWRARLYEDIEHNLPQALNYYQALNAAYANTYYAVLGRQRIAVIGSREAVPPAPALAAVHPAEDPQLTAALPENDPHLIKSRLLANAGLNEYIKPEIHLSATANSWGTLAEAEIYQSFGEDARALQVMKSSGLPFFSLPIAEVPMPYWQLAFPRPYWTQVANDAQTNGLDPFLVISLIRSESAFNAGAVSRANAYGLMQLLPSTGRAMAKREGESHFATNELLDPTENVRLGTLDLKLSIEKYNGQIEYALAAYNAGDKPVRDWIATNDYKDIPEWVESIPYSETREYVQGIMRNREMYRAIYGEK